MAATILLATTMAAAVQNGVTGATVTRSGNDFVLTWTTSGPVPEVTIKQGTDPDVIETLVATVTEGTSATVTGLDPAQRHYFRVKGGTGDGAIAAERVVPQTGVLNFRDTGGYTALNPGGHTKSVRWGLFFRAGAPSPTLKSTDLVAPRLNLTPAIMQAVIDEMVQRYGSVGNYLSQGLGITAADLEAIRANLLKG